MATERITFTLDTDDPKQKAIYDQIAALQNRSATLREIVMAYFSGETVTNAESSPPASTITESGLAAAISKGIVDGLKQSGLAIAVHTNGNGHHAEPEPEEEMGFDPNDDLVKRLANPQFDEF